MSQVCWRALFPEWRRLLLAVFVCAALMNLAALVPPVPDDEKRYMEAFTWFLPGVLWAFLVCTRPLHLAWQMVGLRLPGSARLLWLSSGANIVLLLCAAGLLAGADDLGRVAGTLLLGWGLGLLVLVLPAHWSAPFVVAAVWLGAQYGRFWWPNTAIEFWLSTLLVLSLGALLWWRQCSSGRPWQSIGVLLDVPMLAQLEQVQKNASSSQIQSKGVRSGASPMQRLRAVLAPELKGFLLEWRWRSGGLFALSLGTLAGLLIWLEPAGLLKIMVAHCLVAASVLLMAIPTRYFLAEQTRASQALIAELGLLPGLPRGRQWLWAMCVQILRGMFERLLAVGLLASLVAWSYDLPWNWLQLLWICQLLVLALSLAQALYVGLLGGRRRRWQVLEYSLLGFSGTSCAWLLHGIMPANVVLGIWLAMVAIACIFCLWLLQRLHQRGAPYFS